jgi:hypothetical protein
MKRAPTLALACLLFSATAPALAAKKTAPKAAKEPSIDDNSALKKWVSARVKKAAKGDSELVRFPVVGCMASATCPTWWAIGFSEHMEIDQSGRWLLLLPETGITLPDTGFVGGTAVWGPVLLVEGYFTGVKRWPKESEGFEDPDGEGYKPPEFRVLRFTNASESKSERPLKIVATGAEAVKTVPGFGDDRKWLALVSSKPLFEADSESYSNELKDKLTKAGFSDAELFDSRKAKNLFCCYLSVTAGRYQTKEEAQATVKKLKDAGFDAYAKQGW